MATILELLAKGIRFTGEGIIATAPRDAKLMDFFRNEYKQDADAAYMYYMQTGSVQYPH